MSICSKRFHLKDLQVIEIKAHIIYKAVVIYRQHVGFLFTVIYVCILFDHS